MHRAAPGPGAAPRPFLVLVSFLPPQFRFVPHNYTPAGLAAGIPTIFRRQEPAMPTVSHVEKHFTATAAVRDIVIGMSDGLTVPFALAAGISGAVASNPHASALVVTAGFAEIAAGSIAMGLGGYLAARTDLEDYASERERE